METNINEIIERDWNDAEMDAVEESMETRVDRALDRAWNAVVVTIAVVALSLLCGLWCVCRERRIHERERCLRACPGGTAQRVVDEVNQEPFVRVCNRLADAVFCARNSLAGKGERDEH